MISSAPGKGCDGVPNAVRQGAVREETGGDFAIRQLNLDEHRHLRFRPVVACTCV